MFLRVSKFNHIEQCFQTYLKPFTFHVDPNPFPKNKFKLIELDSKTVLLSVIEADRLRRRRYDLHVKFTSPAGANFRYFL